MRTRTIDQCDETIPLRPTECRRCGAQLSGNDPEPLRHQVWEVPEIKPHVHYLIQEYLAYHHGPRPHQGLGNVPPGMSAAEPESAAHTPLGEVVRRERLGGLRKHDERKAA
jgi:hypothetical protein